MKRFPKSLYLFACWGMVGVILLNIGLAVWSAKEKYTAFDLQSRYPKLKFAYEDSQYANLLFKYWIPDGPVNTYAGLAYVKGVSPILIAADTPPLGRYLIGIFGLLFNNENILTLIVGGISFYLLYLLGRQLLLQKLLALIPPMLVSFEPIIKSQFVYTPLLDLMQLMFLLGYFLVFILALRRKNHYEKYFVIASVLLGCFIATKFFATGITVLAASVIVLLLNFNKHKFFVYCLTLPLTVLILLLSYSKSFIDNPNIKSFLGIQKWVFLYHKSQITTPFAIWPFIYLNQWYVWWGDKPILSEVTWTIMWPIITSISLFTAAMSLFKRIKRNSAVELLLLWVICYLLFFSVGQVSARYLVILLPILYVLSVYGMREYIVLFNKRYKK